MKLSRAVYTALDRLAPTLVPITCSFFFSDIEKVYRTCLVILNPPLLFYIKVVQMTVKKKKINIKKPGWGGGGGGGKINRPGQVAPPPPTPTQVPFFSIFLTLKTSLKDLSCDFKSIFILYLGCTSDGDEKKSTSKTWVGGKINRLGQLTPHPCTN